MEQSPVIHRRKFLKLSGLTSAALFIGISASQNAYGEILAFYGIRKDADELFNLTPYIIIEKSGTITLMNPKPDMGQGTYQSIPALIAEEFEVSLDKVLIRQTSGQKEFGSQVSGGSHSVRGSYFQLRKVGAAAKEMLLQAASQKWNVPVNDCYADEAMIYHQPSGKSISYNDLVEVAAKLPVPQDPQLKDPKDFKILGKSYPRPDIPMKITGKAVFGIDVEVPDMVYASLEVCPVFGGKLISYDDTASMQVKGVQKTIKIQRVLGMIHYDGVAVVADNYWAAYQGRKALKVNWDYRGFDQFNSEDYAQKLRDLAKTDGVIVHNDGDFDNAFANAPVQLEAFYETPVVSHSPMEPMNCVAHWKDDNTVEVWASAQGPELVKGAVAEAADISPDDVQVHILFSGGGFGRRLFPDFAGEAAMISKAAGKPVKLIWTREDDTEYGPFRPMTFSSLKGALSSDGKPVAFQHKVISPSLAASGHPKRDNTKEDGSMVEGISDQPYTLPNMQNRYVFAEFHIPIAAWRSVTSSTLAFAHECFIDEMAIKAGKDPLDFRMEIMNGDQATKNIFTKLKEMSGWGIQSLPAGWGRGVAQYTFFAGQAGYVVVASSQNNNTAVKIEKVYAVIDVGTVVNPDNTKAQVEGAMVMALTAAIKGGITFKGGRTVQSNFNNNPILRINEMPDIEVAVLANGGPVIRGVGEPGLPSFAPALANAVYAATGKRIRKLPFNLSSI
jgi:isoquinoline 1-oxidoreductase subunit beta